MPYLKILADFRENVRAEARILKAGSILKECDLLRDDVLPNVGVRLEDKESKFSWQQRQKLSWKISYAMLSS
jgi:cysteinyl-tRNA synthetase